jgi:RalA-binding protein 1
MATQDQAPPPMVMAGQKRKIYDRRDAFQDDRSSSPATGAPSMFRTQDGDVVDRGIITMEKAAELFARYNDRMLHHLPAVVFPPTMTAAELRRTKPTLFLAIMASAAGEIHNVQRVLQKELMQILATKVIMTGEKHLELVQAVLVAAIWYWPPDHFEELKFYQLIHIAAVMALDIGLGKRTNTNQRVLPVFMWRDQPFARSQPPDSCSLESRRTWLAAYFLATNCALSLHRPVLIRWTSFMNECIEVLETDPDAAPTDKLFCHLIRAHRLMEDVNSQFMADDEGRSVSIGDSRTQFTLRGLERDLEKCKSAVPSDIMDREYYLSCPLA